MGPCKENMKRVKRKERMSGSIRIGALLSYANCILVPADYSFCMDRMSGLWGPQSSLDLYLQEEGIQTLFMSGVNADQVSLLLLHPLADDQTNHVITLSAS